MNNNLINDNFNIFLEKLFDSEGYNQTGGTTYKCDPKKPYEEICVIDEKGDYKNKDLCQKYCEFKYIGNELNKSGLARETIKFQNFIEELIEQEKIEVYIKGGNALGLKILRMVYDKYPGKEFDTYFEKFLELDLIKDWDFAGYYTTDITPEHREKLDIIAASHKLVPRAKTFILYQTRVPILTEDKALFEIALLNSEKFSNLEIPLTTMKVKMNKENIKYIFAFANSFYLAKLKGEKINTNLVKKLISKINVFIYPYFNGMYKTTDKTFDKGELSDELISLIQTFEDFDKEFPQFLITHIKEPNRLLYRLLGKNIPKTDKINSFIEDNKLESKQFWLLNTKKVEKVIDIFVPAISDKILQNYNSGYDSTKSPESNELDKIKAGILLVSKFLSNITLSRIEIEYPNFNLKALDLLKLMFNLLYLKVKTELATLYKELDMKDKQVKNNIIYILHFLEEKGLLN